MWLHQENFSLYRTAGIFCGSLDPFWVGCQGNLGVWVHYVLTKRQTSSLCSNTDTSQQKHYNAQDFPEQGRLVIGCFSWKEVASEMSSVCLNLHLQCWNAENSLWVFSNQMWCLCYYEQIFICELNTPLHIDTLWF